VPHLTNGLPADQLSQLLSLPILSRSISFSQLTQIYIPFLTDDYVFRNLSSFSSLLKLYIFKLQMKGKLDIASESIKELDIDVEEFDEDGDRIYHTFELATLTCPRLHRVRLSGLKLSSANFSRLFEFVDSSKMSNLRHLQLELKLDEGVKTQVRNLRRFCTAPHSTNYLWIIIMPVISLTCRWIVLTYNRYTCAA